MDMERMIQEAFDNGYLRGYEKGKADRPQGEWIEHIGGISHELYYFCDQCYGEVDTNDYDFCPHCGARMKGADDE